MKIDRYQGFLRRNGEGTVNDHQNNECVVHFNHIPKEKSDILFKVCLNVLNEEVIIEDGYIKVSLE